MSKALRGHVRKERSPVSDFCKYCRGGNNYHTERCSRNAPDAERLYEEGYCDGRWGRDAAQDEPAYRAGYLQGEIALESAQNGYDAWGY